jgi:hypothetical protein
MLIDFCIDENILPQCPSRHCGIVLILKDLKGLNGSYITKYNQLCMDFFIKSNGNRLEQEIQNNKVMEKLLQQRRQFMNDNYPKAISLVASITFQNKMNQVNKTKKEKQVQNMKRCFNTVCKGFLNDDFQCQSCQNVFCKKCETVVYNAHLCKQSDLDSVNLINNMVKCPGCQLPVFKNEGCNHITCSVCKTNFNYNTGEQGGSGSNNKSIMIKNNNYKLSDLYKEQLIPLVFDKLVAIEARKPSVISKDSLLIPVKKYIETKDTKYYEQLAIKMNKYYLNSVSIRDYESALIAFEQLIKNKGNEDKQLLLLNNM